MPISGNYHEYNFGPRLDPKGRMWVTTNKPFGSQPLGKELSFPRYGNPGAG